MGGFVVFEGDRAWGVSNAAWRATVTPVMEVLPEGSAARLRIEHAVRDAIHYLDLTDAPPPVLAEIRLALGEVLVHYERGDRTWGDEAQTSSFLWSFRGLLAMFDDPDMGRPLWPDPKRTSRHGLAGLRRIRDDERDEVLAIVNAAAEAYRGVIPADRWHDPYMSGEELEREIAAGVAFWGIEGEDGALVGVMGIQAVRDVDLIRHAYVRPENQGEGIGGRLLADLKTHAERPLLVGTWAAAEWAIRFYERNGFALVPRGEKDRLLTTYWSIPERQIETSVVLAHRP